MEHVCLRPARPTGALGPDRPAWAEPGALTKVADEDRWGRVDLLWQCCGARDVAVARQGAEGIEVLHLPVDALENPVGAHALPHGVAVPAAWPRGRRT